MTNEAAVREAIEKNNRLIEYALHAGDPKVAASLYDAESLLYPPHLEPVAGTSAILAFWQRAIDMGVAAIRIVTAQVELAGSRAIETGTYTLLAEDDLELDRGSYLVVWKETQGAWTIHRDIWNSSNPPQR
jgi:ketosteroid isomerase-like protein